MGQVVVHLTSREGARFGGKRRRSPPPPARLPVAIERDGRCGGDNVAAMTTTSSTAVADQIAGDRGRRAGVGQEVGGGAGGSAAPAGGERFAPPTAPAAAWRLATGGAAQPLPCGRHCGGSAPACERWPVRQSLWLRRRASAVGGGGGGTARPPQRRVLRREGGLGEAARARATRMGGLGGWPSGGVVAPARCRTSGSRRAGTAAGRGEQSSGQNSRQNAPGLRAAAQRYVAIGGAVRGAAARDGGSAPRRPRRQPRLVPPP